MHNQNKKLLLGAHMSAAGGLENAIIEAERLGCTAVQFFSKSNRQWKSKPLTTDEIARFQNAHANSSIKSIIIHASYLINVGSPNPQTQQQAAYALKEELIRAEQLKADALVLHPGSHLHESSESCIERIAQTINDICDSTQLTHTKLLLETMAGQGSSVGHTFEQLAHLLSFIKQKESVGICLDTCHVFAAGYDIKNRYDEVITQFDKTIGLNKLKAIHLNDSKKELGSHVDRHEHIGKGMLGLEPFRAIMNDERIAHVPKILETPKDSPDDDIRNLQIIKELLKPAL